MKVKASLVVSAVGVLRSMDMTQMKLSTSFKVKKMLNECQVAVEDFEKRRVALAEKHGTLTEDKSKYEFETDEAREAFQIAMQEMMDDELDINIEPIDIELLDDHIKIEPANVDLVSWFISGLE